MKRKDHRSPHPALEDLALLAEGRLEEIEASPLREHLAGCRACISAYGEAAKVRFDLLRQVLPTEVPDDLIEVAESVAARPRDVRAREPAGTRLRWLAPRRLAYGFGVVAVLSALFFVTRPARDPAMTSASIEQIRFAVETMSMRPGAANGHHMVMPGGERAAGTVAAAEAAHRGDGELRLEAALDRLVTRYARGETTEELAFWMISGFVVSGRLEAAEPYLRRARAEFPESRRIALLGAVVAYRESRLEEAESLFRDLAARDPADLLVRLDLGILLKDATYEGHDPEEARRLFLAIEAASPSSPLAERARLERGDLDGD